MNRDLAWWLRIAVPAAAVTAVGAGLVVGGVFGGADEPGKDRPAGTIGADGISLVAYDSCQSALDELRGAALPLVGPYGLGGGGRAIATDAGGAEDSGAGGAAPPAAPGAAPERNAAPSAGEAGDAQQKSGAPGHSTTNTHEAGVDEPDLVKTDGRRLITIADGRLRVVDVASRTEAKALDLPGGPATQLLISGDRALVMIGSGAVDLPQRGGRPLPHGPGYQSQLVLVDLANGPEVIGTLAVDGAYLDARQVGSVARVVLRSGPRFEFVHPDGTRSQSEATRYNRGVVERSSISDWLPHFELERNGKRDSGPLVECADVSRPESYTGTSMLTVLTIDLTRELGVGDPVSIVADGDTVYGTGSSLYVADDRQSHGDGFRPGVAPRPAERTEIYQFDISQRGKPVYVASGGVDGVLLNQYSLSEFGGHLRVATTVNQTGKSESAVTVLVRRQDTLTRVGWVGGLGVGERIYAVRFLGPVGYVVTFRQTDPLYTVDLSDPARPKVVGDLKITGYSAYLHPAGEGRLIGVGQEATNQGRRTGTQVSLFDTGNLTTARRLAQYQLPGGTSEVEYDPHAFLYWPDKGILVVPVMVPERGGVSDAPSKPGSGALVLRLTGDSFAEVGMVSHPVDGYRYPDGSVRRALVIGDELWTVSGAGVMVNDLERLAQRAWIPFS